MKLSITIPTHNRVGFLLEAIDSVIEQDVEGCEVIICDDGSTDDLMKACSRYGDTSPVIISRTDQRLGAQVARNRGLDMAKGDFVLFLDSDDVLASGGLDLLSRVLQTNCDLDYVYGKVVRCDEKLEPKVGDSPVGSAFSDTPFDIAGYHWHTMGALYRKSFLEKVGHWNVDLTGSQDWEFQARVKLESGKCHFVDTVVGYWRQHDGDRVGATKFRPDYVNSVMIACGVILSRAREKNRCDKALEMRLAKKLFVHALEWGANGYWSERKGCMQQARQCLTSGVLFKIGLSLANYTPPILDSIFLRLIQTCTKAR